MDKSSPMHKKPLVNVTCKLGVNGCFKDGRCHALGDCENKIETNADQIRAMTDEELAKVIMCPKENGAQVGACIGKTCVECCLMWLRQPAEEDAP